MPDPTAPIPPADIPRLPGGAGRLRLGAVAAVAVGAALVTWLLVSDDDSSDSGSSGARAASVGELRDFAASLSRPVYWAGARPGDTYELTANRGNVFVRYLPRGVNVGDRRPDFTTVGTYPYKRAYSRWLRAANSRGEQPKLIPRGGIAVISERSRKSVFLAFPKRDYLVEVFDPAPDRAMRLATSGRVKPIR
jgi:hypothetical protein